MRLGVLLLFALSIAGGCATGQRVDNLAAGQTGWLAYPSSVTPSVILQGELLFPENSQGRVPAMVIAHASAGLDARSERWARFFREHGFATMKIDYFGPRGVRADSAEQPVPTNDVFDALRLLTTHPRIDLDRIGVIGFSRGAHLAVNSASPGLRDTGGHHFAAHVGLYPTCGLTDVGRDKLTSPILILVGSDDDICPVVQCEILVKGGLERGRDVRLIVYDGAQHGWDGDYTGVWFHRALNTSYRLKVDSALTERSRRDILDFLKEAMKL